MAGVSRVTAAVPAVVEVGQAVSAVVAADAVAADAVVADAGASARMERR
jgi:hypothetical protein